VSDIGRRLDRLEGRLGHPGECTCELPWQIVWPEEGEASAKLPEAGICAVCGGERVVIRVVWPEEDEGWA
jgi:hypothetical protein